MYREKDIHDLEQDWKTNLRWSGITRSYSAKEVVKLRGSIHIDRPLARLGSDKLWNLLQKETFIRALGAMTGNQAVQQVQAGLKAIYVSGWQVAADMNDAHHTYPDQSLYPVLSVPHLVKRINNALIRADQIDHLTNNHDHHIDWFAPLIADAEAGFGGPLNAFELVKALIEEGVAAIHIEDQLSSLKKCGHMGGKVLVPISDFIQKLVTGRLAADVLGIPTLFIARTDADSASMIRSDSDSVDQPFLTGKRSYEGFYYVKGGVEYAIARGLAAAPYSEMIWCETSKPDLGQAKEFAQGIHEKYPGKWLAYNCSPSFNWLQHLSEKEIGKFQEKLGEMGYKFQFVTLAGFHTLNASMFELAHRYNHEGMAAYAQFQQHEFKLEEESGYRAVKHQSFVGTGYFDEVMMAVTEQQSSTKAMEGSTEAEQFHPAKKKTAAKY